MSHWQVKHESFHVAASCKSFMKVFHFRESVSWKSFAFIKVFHEVFRFRESVSWKSFMFLQVSCNNWKVFGVICIIVMITQHCFDIYSNLHSNIKVATESTASRPTPRPMRNGRGKATDAARPTARPTRGRRRDRRGGWLRTPECISCLITNAADGVADGAVDSVPTFTSVLYN